MKLSSNDKLYLIFLRVLLLIGLNTYEHNLELLRSKLLMVTFSSEKIYLNHCIIARKEKMRYLL
jgi:hypothetical protein